MKNRRNKKGFTIVELVIVIGVIGILSAILIPTFVSLNGKAEAARLQSNLHNAFSMYAADAADGKLDKDEDVELAQVSQAEVFVAATSTLADGGACYVWNSTAGSWTATTADADKTAVCSPNESYLGYYMFY